ncbi:MAG: hypothetical protein N2234_07960, partial [Planctomycetota bacterium]|nr:hypothetical protein [Planctomycetota bacterium]
YGDPAWDARVATGKDVKVPKPVWETEIKEKGKSEEKTEFELVIKFNADVDFNPEGFVYYRPVFAFTPRRLSEIEVLNKEDAEVLEITDNFVIVKYKGVVKKGSTKRLTFKAKVLDTGDK